MANKKNKQTSKTTLQIVKEAVRRCGSDFLSDVLGSILRDTGYMISPGIYVYRAILTLRTGVEYESNGLRWREHMVNRNMEDSRNYIYKGRKRYQEYYSIFRKKKVCIRCGKPARKDRITCAECGKKYNVRKVS